MTTFFNGQIAFENQAVTIRSGQTTSGMADLNGLTAVGFIIPATFTGTALGFKGSVNGTTFATLTNASGTALSATVVAGTFLLVSATDFIGIRLLQIVSNATEAADRSVIVVARSMT